MTGIASVKLFEPLERRVFAFGRGVSNLSDVFIGGVEMVLDPVGVYHSSRVHEYAPASSLGMRGVQLLTKDFVPARIGVPCWEEEYRGHAWIAGVVLGVGASVVSYGVLNIAGSFGSLAYQGVQKLHRDSFDHRL